MKFNMKIIATTVIALAVIGLAGWAMATNADLERMLGWAGMFATMAYNAINSAAQNKEIKEDTEQIKAQTNGQLIARDRRISELEAELEQYRKEG